MKKPKGFEEYLGEYGPQLYDGWSGECIAWGFHVLQKLGDEKWAELSKYGAMECAHGTYSSDWYLITKELTRAQAIKKYGKITDEEFGPRCGWKSVTFGDKKFGSRRLMK